ncbi:hypothetical protein [Staphylococcus edaphicus]|uniref:Uncharacterized protein n=1 Tax=Staphylococcus edaphicus TaxID=1955013 RepID=A0ABY4Q9N9_9STAP|nr:hypothetical protein [Staphylococcus edaphicus]UQW80689.1 hypothetical protein MNY58_08800 [Staphylococcus edaphicus]
MAKKNEALKYVNSRTGIQHDYDSNGFWGVIRLPFFDDLKKDEKVWANRE